MTVPLVPEAVKPEPVQEVALVEDHVSVTDWPLVIEVDETMSLAVGAGVTGVVVAVVEPGFVCPWAASS